MSKLLKDDIINTIKEKLNNKELQLKEAIKLVQESSNNNSKSTAGDKHDTERAMAQLEIEKLQKQYATLINDIKQFERSKNSTNAEKVGLGSLIELSGIYIFISCGIGKIEINGENVFVISLDAPIAKSIIGKQIGEEVLINNIKKKIISIQ